LNRLRSVDDDSDDLNNINLLPGGNETNLDNLDKDQVLQMINQQMNGNGFDSDSDKQKKKRRFK